MELRWYERDGWRLAWTTAGPAHATPVVAVPGLTDGLGPLWLEQVRRGFADEPPRVLKGFRVLLLSHRRPVPDTVTTETLAADLARFLTDVVDGPVDVTGHSMGGMVAQHLASERPDLVRRLVLSATVGAADAGVRGVIERWERLLRERRWRAFSRDAIDVSFTGGARLRRRTTLRMSPTPDLEDRLARHLALSHACRTHDARAALPRITAPTLVIAGERDPIGTPPHARRLAAAIPDARLEVLGRVAHGFPEQAPRRYARLLADFLRT